MSELEFQKPRTRKNTTYIDTSLAIFRISFRIMGLAAPLIVLRPLLPSCHARVERSLGMRDITKVDLSRGERGHGFYFAFIL